MAELPYDYPNATQNVTDLFNYIAQVTTVGDFSVFWNGIVLSIFIIMFIGTARFEIEEQITTSAFVATLSAYLLNAMGLTHPFLSILFTILLGLTIIIFYIRRSSE